MYIIICQLCLFINIKLCFCEEVISERKLRYNGEKRRSAHQVSLDYQLTDEDLLEQVLRTYRILINRAVMGAYIYVCDDELREYLGKFF